jgi:error-prone DNA polymerase
VADYSHLRLSLKAHPLSLLRPVCDAERITPAEAFPRHQGRVSVAGLVLVRQRPGTASGVIFMTLEDETGVSNIVVWPSLFEKNRLAVLTGRLVQITGRLQNEDNVLHVIAEQIIDRSAWLDDLAGPPLKVASRDFH